MPNAPNAYDINYAYYRAIAPGMDEYWRKMAAPQMRISTLLRLLAERPPLSLVDLGCGNGYLLSQLCARHPTTEFAGIDLSDTQLAVNRRQLPGIAFYEMDLCQPRLRLPPRLVQHFDAVVAAEIIEHVEDPLRFLSNARSLATSRGGRLLLTTQSGPLRETERRVGHVRHFTIEEMHSLLTKAGWEPLCIWNCGFPFHDLSKWYANLDPDASMRSFGEQRYGLWQNLICSALRLAFRFNSKRRGAQLFAVAHICKDRRQPLEEGHTPSS